MKEKEDIELVPPLINNQINKYQRK